MGRQSKKGIDIWRPYGKIFGMDQKIGNEQRLLNYNLQTLNSSIHISSADVDARGKIPKVYL